MYTLIFINGVLCYEYEVQSRRWNWQRPRYVLFGSSWLISPAKAKPACLWAGVSSNNYITSTLVITHQVLRTHDLGKQGRIEIFCLSLRFLKCRYYGNWDLGKTVDVFEPQSLMCFSTRDWIGLSMIGTIRSQNNLCIPKRRWTNLVSTTEGRDRASQEWWNLIKWRFGYKILCQE